MLKPIVYKKDFKSIVLQSSVTETSFSYNLAYIIFVFAFVHQINLTPCLPCMSWVTCGMSRLMLTSKTLLAQVIKSCTDINIFKTPYTSLIILGRKQSRKLLRRSCDTDFIGPGWGLAVVGNKSSGCWWRCRLLLLLLFFFIPLPLVGGLASAHPGRTLQTGLWRERLLQNFEDPLDL